MFGVQAMSSTSETEFFLRFFKLVLSGEITPELYEEAYKYSVRTGIYPQSLEEKLLDYNLEDENDFCERYKGLIQEGIISLDDLKGGYGFYFRTGILPSTFEKHLESLKEKNDIQTSEDGKDFYKRYELLVQEGIISLKDLKGGYGFYYRTGILPSSFEKHLQTLKEKEEKNEIQTSEEKEEKEEIQTSEEKEEKNSSSWFSYLSSYF